MKHIVIVSFVIYSFNLFANESLIFGKWYVDGAICALNGQSEECPKLKNKILVTQTKSHCNSFQINLTSFEAENKSILSLNNCDDLINEKSLFSIYNGYHFYSLETKPLGKGRDIVLYGSENFLEVYFYSNGGFADNFNSRSRRYFLSKKILN